MTGLPGVPEPGALRAGRSWVATGHRFAQALGDALEGQRGHLFPWVPVCLGIGIAIWFALPVEPGKVELGAVLLLSVTVAVGAALGPDRFRPLAVAVALFAAGFGLAGMRGAAVAEPVLGFRYYGPVEGRLIEVDRSSSDRLRLLLDQVVLARVDPADTPARVRISLHSDIDRIGYEPGQRVILTANISPPSGSFEPGDFDFRRHAWFEGLGAVGYSRTPVLLLEPAEEGSGLWINRVRQHLAQAIRARIPGDAGGYAAAVTTGDRSGLSIAANDAMRDSNLYHLVSISGMHMGMLAAFVFGLVRYGLALIPPLALRLPAKKVAATVALAAAVFYLALAGRNVPTERAFVQVAVMLVAVLCDRRALSLRAVAIAATIILVIRPETLMNAGFHMSFAATAALISAFEAARGLSYAGRRRIGWAMPVLTLLFSSFVAGMATAPYAAAHFNRVAEYGLLANLLAVPAMGMLVMPGAVILAITGPLGLDWPAVWMIEGGSRWILYVAQRVSSLEGAVSAVSSPPDAVLPLVTLGGLFLIIWRGRARLAGLAPVALAFLLWAGAERPALLIAPDGAIVGVMTAEGRALSKPSSGLAARGWLQNDGDETPQVAADRGAFREVDGVALARVGGTEVVHLFGRGWRERLDEACAPGRIVVTSQKVDDTPKGGCILYDARKLGETGAIAGHVGTDGVLTLSTARAAEGRRWWTGARPR